MSALAQMLLASYAGAPGGGAGVAQDLTTYTEVDPSTNITVTAARVTATTLARSTAARVVKDFGADYFSGAFVVDFDVRITAETTGATALLCMLSDTAGTLNSVGAACGMSYYFGGGSDRRLSAVEKAGGVVYTPAWSVAALSTTYYLRLRRDPSAGANGTLYLHIASSAANRTAQVWVATQALALQSLASLRYLHVMTTLGSGSGNFSGWGENYTVAP